MEKQHFSVARVVTHTKENISKFERHDERRNTTYSNTNIVAERTPMNIYFKRYDSTLNQKFDEMVKNGQISTRGLMSIFSGSYGSLGGNRFSFSSFFFIMFSPFIFPDNSLLCYLGNLT